MIEIVKDIIVFGAKISKGCLIKRVNKDSDVLIMEYGIRPDSIQMPIICNAYNKTADEFIEEICLQNTGQSYLQYTSK